MCQADRSDNDQQINPGSLHYFYIIRSSKPCKPDSNIHTGSSHIPNSASSSSGRLSGMQVLATDSMSKMYDRTPTKMACSLIYMAHYYVRQLDQGGPVDSPLSQLLGFVRVQNGILELARLTVAGRFKGQSRAPDSDKFSSCIGLTLVPTQCQAYGTRSFLSIPADPPAHEHVALCFAVPSASISVSCCKVPGAQLTIRMTNLKLSSNTS